MNKIPKSILISVIGASVAAVCMCLFFTRIIPSLSYQGNFVEKHLWTESTRVYGEPRRVSDYFEVWDKYHLTNPLDHSIWFTGRKMRGSGFIEAMIEGQVARGSPTAAAYSKPPGNRWITGRHCGGDGFHEIEIPTKSTIVVMLPARTKSQLVDLDRFSKISA